MGCQIWILYTTAPSLVSHVPPPILGVLACHLNPNLQAFSFCQVMSPSTRPCQFSNASIFLDRILYGMLSPQMSERFLGGLASADLCDSEIIRLRVSCDCLNLGSPLKQSGQITNGEANWHQSNNQDGEMMTMSNNQWRDPLPADYGRMPDHRLAHQRRILPAVL